MMYKIFAAITLIAAPIIVLVAQNAVPQQQPQPSAIQPPPAQAVASPPQPEATQFGQPMPEAGKPFLAPGDGLPAAQTALTQGEVGTEEEPAITDR